MTCTSQSHKISQFYKATPHQSPKSTSEDNLETMPAVSRSNDIVASATGGTGEDSTTNTKATTEGNDNLWTPSKKQVVCVILVACIAIALTLGLCLGLLLDNDDCNTKAPSYSISFQMKNTAPEIETSNSSSVYFTGANTITWTCPLVSGPQSTFVSSFGRSWFERAIRIRNVNPATMSLTVFNHNKMRKANLLSYAFSPEEITSPLCEPPVLQVDLYSVPIGGSSEVFNVGVCRVSRLDNESLEPREIEVVFTDSVSIERNEE
jgi:hypothetical protein